MKKLAIILLCFTACTQSQKPKPGSAQDYLDKSIAFHDPQDQWQHAAMKLVFEEVDPERAGLVREVTMINETREFIYYKKDSLNEYQYSVQGDTCDVLFNETRDFTAEESELYNLDCNMADVYKDYYTYIYGLPMKLKDPGTIVHDEVMEEEFNGTTYYSIRVTYDEKVGKDTWYFYLDQETFELKGYRFHHDEEKFDGEYVTLDGLIDFSGIKIPQNRAWYINGSQEYLSTDVLASIKPL